MHSCGNTAIKGWSWPNFWANLASFSPGPACTAARSSRPSCRSRAGTAASRAAGRRAAPRRKSPRARRLPQHLHEGSSVITPRSFSFIWTTPIGPETAVQNDGRPSSSRRRRKKARRRPAPPAPPGRPWARAPPWRPAAASVSLREAAVSGPHPRTAAAANGSCS